jgi:hypothetical protein
MFLEVIMKKATHVLLSLMTVFSHYAMAGKPVAKIQPQQNSAKEITVYRSATCMCCEKWVSHLKENHYKVNDNVIDDVQPIKNKYGVSAEMASCHTALIDDYVVEGHVPAADIEQLLKKKPNVVGISVPGMPTGTPGMEMGGKKDTFSVYSFDDKNQKAEFNQYPGQ